MVEEVDVPLSHSPRIAVLLIPICDTNDGDAFSFIINFQHGLLRMAPFFGLRSIHFILSVFLSPV